MNAQALEKSFGNLRERWPNGWPGLPLVLQQCLRQLGCHSGIRLGARQRVMHRCMDEVAQCIEQDGRTREAAGEEPAYHNRLHMADTLVALTGLLLAQRAVDRSAAKKPSLQESVAMLAMLGHDFLHDGSVNTRPAELESRSVDCLRPWLQRNGVAEADQALMAQLILATDPAVVGACHDRVEDRTFSTRDPDCLVVLVQEADIMASTMPVIGPALTRQLATEWERLGPEQAGALLSASGRLKFLTESARFSSPASQQLGMNAIKSDEIRQLRDGRDNRRALAR